MNCLFLILGSLFSALSFFAYAISSLVSPRMISEFERFGMSSSRVLICILQILGAAGLIVGCFVTPIGILAAGALALMMLVAVGVRIKIGDGFLLSLPAVLYLILNSALVYLFLSCK
ncbi:MAG: DoxX family protein [Opitutales bacterium]|nr:DoxX family protein [Opitutales bacterium]